MEPNSNAGDGADGTNSALLLIGRRFFLPVALTVAAIDLAFFLFAARGVSPLDNDPGILLAALLMPLVPVGLGMLVVGLPAGLLVARLRLGFVESLALLIAIGFGVPAVLAGLLIGLLAEALIFGLPGGLAAAIWTLVNHDLFRRHNGA